MRRRKGGGLCGEWVNDICLFEYNKNVKLDMPHIKKYLIDRFPIAFLENTARYINDTKAIKIIDDYKKHPKNSEKTTEDTKPEDKLRELIKIFDDNTLLMNKIENELVEAVEYVKKRCRWQYKTAIPSYFVFENKLQLLLPLYLQGNGCGRQENKVDAVLLIEKTEEGSAYQAHTVLTPEMAYVNSRLISRPESSWLNLGD